MFGLRRANPGAWQLNPVDLLIPCKNFERGKSRLASMLTSEKRIELCRRFFDKTLLLAGELNGRTAVVSDDENVRQLAVNFGAMAIEDPGKDLNDALNHANDLLVKSSVSNGLIVLPTDLPLATAEALGPFLSDGAEVMIAPDRRKAGTNILRLSSNARTQFSFLYGENSFQNHVNATTHLRLSLKVIRDVRLALDIDEPADLRFTRDTTNAA